MQISITGHHIEVTEPLRTYVNKKMDRILRHYDQMIDVHYVLSVEKLRHIAEATLRVPGSDIHANAEAADMYAAIDALADKLDRLVKKRKEIDTDHHATEGRKARQ
ncbi:MAG: ribosome hibernation-promoting factor, HPF/YfiA family [Steroidobacteraceae bacterium]|jgi:putative sigma-54 modulation protein|nr:ribosome-associated translation inhibitor RaiA [Gammaproteobacteria bacterium]